MPVLTVSSTVPNVGGAGTHPASYTEIANVDTRFGNFNTANFTPPSTASIGDLLVCTVVSPRGNPTTAVGGTGSTGWRDCGNGAVLNASTGDAVSQWFGQLTSLGAQSVSATMTGFNSFTTAQLVISEFTCAGVSPTTVWAVESFGKTNGNTTSSVAATLTPVITPEIHYAYQDNSNGNTATPGGTAGFAYAGFPSDGAIWCYDVAAAGALTPTVATFTATTPWQTLSALFNATLPTATVGPVEIDLPPIVTGLMWVISQVTFEFLPAVTATNLLATILLNGRVVRAGINPVGGTGALATFQGPPNIAVRAGDTMSVQITNVPVGISAIANFFYTELPANATPTQIGTVV